MAIHRATSRAKKAMTQKEEARTSANNWTGGELFASRAKEAISVNDLVPLSSY